MMNVCSLVFSEVPTKVPWETHGRRNSLHFRLLCVSRVAPNLSLFWDESTHKSRWECQQRKDFLFWLRPWWLFQSTFTLRNSIPLDCTSAVEEQVSFFVHFCTYILCLLRVLCCSPQRCLAFAETRWLYWKSIAEVSTLTPSVCFSFQDQSSAFEEMQRGN